MPILSKHFTYRNSFNLHDLPKRDIHNYHTHLTNEETEDSLLYGEEQVCAAERLINGRDHGATQVPWLQHLELKKGTLETRENLVDTRKLRVGTHTAKIEQQNSCQTKTTKPFDLDVLCNTLCPSLCHFVTFVSMGNS